MIHGHRFYLINPLESSFRGKHSTHLIHQGNTKPDSLAGLVVAGVRRRVETSMSTGLGFLACVQIAGLTAPRKANT